MASDRAHVKGSNTPRISIGLPVYNAERYLEEALGSLQEQTFRDIEIIVSDNASTDRTAEIVAKAAAADDRIVYVRSEVNRGAAWNFNNTVHLARAPLFCWAAGDDSRHPELLERCAAALDAAQDTVVAYPMAIDIGPDGEELKRWGPMPRATDPDPIVRFRDVVENERVAFSVFGLMRLDLLRKTRLIAPFAGSDWSLLAELALLGRFTEVPEELFLHREHPERSTRVHAHSRDRAAWFDTTKGGKVTYPYWCLLRAYFSAASRHPQGVARRARAVAVAGRWTWEWRRRLAQEIKLGVRSRLKRRRSATH